MPKNRKRRYIKFILQPFAKEIYVCRPKTTGAEAEKIYKRLKLEPPMDFTEDKYLSGATCPLDNGGAFMYFPNTEDATIVHEACHVTFNVLKNCGVPVRQTFDEVFAYTTDHLFTEIKKALKSMS